MIKNYDLVIKKKDCDLIFMIKDYNLVFTTKNYSLVIIIKVCGLIVTIKDWGSIITAKNWDPVANMLVKSYTIDQFEFRVINVIKLFITMSFTKRFKEDLYYKKRCQVY